MNVSRMALIKQPERFDDNFHLANYVIVGRGLSSRKRSRDQVECVAMTQNEGPRLSSRTVVLLSYPAGALVFFGTFFLTGFLFMEFVITKANPTPTEGMGVAMLGLSIALIVSLIASTISFFVFLRYLIRINLHPVMGGVGFVLGPIIAAATFWVLTWLGPLLDPDGKAFIIVVILCLVVAPTIIGKVLVNAGIQYG